MGGPIAQIFSVAWLNDFSCNAIHIVLGIFHHILKREKQVAKLNQIIAVEKGIKSQAHSEISDLYKVVQKPALFNGFVKEYRRNDESGDELPSESQRVQHTVSDVLRSLERTVTAEMDVTARKDWTNTEAMADVVVDGDIVVEQAPVTYLLFLEKKLTDMRTFFAALPVQDAAEDWKFDGGAGIYKSGEIKTHRTQKVQQPIVLYDATPEHPAQTQLITKDVTAGYWHQTKHTGAIEKTRRDVLVDRTDKLLRAVKEAREKANSADEVTPPSVGKDVFSYLMGS